MATLQGRSLDSTYKGLLFIDNSNAGVDGTLRDVQDGEGTVSSMQLSSAAAKFTGTMEVTGATTLTGGGALTGTWTDLGTVTTVVINGGTISGITDLAVADGGTGQSSYTDGQLLIGNTTGSTLGKATITAGAGISVVNGASSITIAATGTGISMGKAIAAAMIFG